jgi:peptidyl-prolyl cis-trans isomerase B (cyclophilin B)
MNPSARFVAVLIYVLMLASLAFAQNIPAPQKSGNAVKPQQNGKAAESSKNNNATAPSKKNSRPATAQTPAPARPAGEPFDGASAAKMSDQCVTLETEAGVIALEMLPEAAPESVRNFLNLAATGAFDTTTFSRVIKGFVIQGGNLSTGQKWSMELAQRSARGVPDEPNYVKHVRGVLSMARGDKPNSATTHFFILAGDAPHLDGKFAAFGRVTSGIEVVDEINHAPTDGDKPVKPVHITHAVVAPCVKG